MSYIVLLDDAEFWHKDLHMIGELLGDFESFLAKLYHIVWELGGGTGIMQYVENM